MSFFFISPLPRPFTVSLWLNDFFSEFIPNLGAWAVGVQYGCETLAGLELPRLFAESEACLQCA